MKEFTKIHILETINKKRLFLKVFFDIKIEYLPCFFQLKLHRIFFTI